MGVFAARRRTVAWAALTRTACVIAAAGLILAAAALLRFSNLDSNAFAFDETVTSVRVAGRTLAEFERQLDTASMLTSREVASFLGNHGDRRASATVASLAAEDPQHPPFYYLAERSWEYRDGTSTAARRTLAVLAGVALVAGIGWLSFVLFGSRRVAFAASALAAVSPMHVWYAHQAREYSLWSLEIVLATALLVVALRGNDPWAWFGYAATITASLFTLSLSIAVLIVHAGVVVVLRPGGTRTTAFFVSIVTALVTFAPWMDVLIAHHNGAAFATLWAIAGALGVPAAIAGVIALEVTVAFAIAGRGHAPMLRAAAGAALVGLGIAACLNAPRGGDASLAAIAPIVAAHPHANLVVPPHHFLALQLANAALTEATMSRLPLAGRHNFVVASKSDESVLRRRYRMHEVTRSGALALWRIEAPQR